MKIKRGRAHRRKTCISPYVGNISIDNAPGPHKKNEKVIPRPPITNTIGSPVARSRNKSTTISMVVSPMPISLFLFNQMFSRYSKIDIFNKINNYLKKQKKAC